MKTLRIYFTVADEFDVPDDFEFCVGNVDDYAETSKFNDHEVVSIDQAMLIGEDGSYDEMFI